MKTISELTPEQRLENIERNLKFQARTEIVKWIVSVCFFLFIVYYVDGKKTELSLIVHENTENVNGAAKRLDSAVEQVGFNRQRIDSNKLKIKFNTGKIDSLKDVIKK